MSQDRGSQLGFDAASLSQAWAPDLAYRVTAAGHVMAEEGPAYVAAFITDIAARCGR